MPRLPKSRSARAVSKAHYFRLNLTLPESMDRFLEEVGIEAKAGKGYKLPKTLILRALIRLMSELDVDVGGVKTEEELLDRLLAALKRKPR